MSSNPPSHNPRRNISSGAQQSRINLHDRDNTTTVNQNTQERHFEEATTQHTEEQYEWPMDEPSSEHEERHPEKGKLDAEIDCAVLSEHLRWFRLVGKRRADEIHHRNCACEKKGNLALLFQYYNSRHVPSALNEISGSRISPNHSSEIFPPHEHAQLIRQVIYYEHWGSNEIDQTRWNMPHTNSAVVAMSELAIRRNAMKNNESSSASAVRTSSSSSCKARGTSSIGLNAFPSPGGFCRKMRDAM